MLNIDLIRKNPELVKKAVSEKNADVDVDNLLATDVKRRDLVSRVETLRQERNQAADVRDIERGKKIKQDLEKAEKELSGVQESFTNLMLRVPNIPAEGVPEGDESHNRILRREGTPRQFTFAPKDHLELGEKLGIIDIERAAKVSGTRFAYLKNEGAILEIALVCFALDKLVKEGFSPIIPPVLIKQEIIQDLGYQNDYYLISETANPLYLVGTGEHSVVPMHKDEVLDDTRKYAAFSPCFRRESGSYGKDTRGILRVHQFEKVEMVAFVRPADDLEIRTKLLQLAENIVLDLGLPYQLVKLATGDLSFPAAETVDIETWIPSQNKYRETHSISTTTDFQARRLNTKIKSDGKTDYAHILNGTAIAIGRMIIAILENYQEEDGSVKIPEILVPYTGFSQIKPK